MTAYAHSIRAQLLAASRWILLDSLYCFLWAAAGAALFLFVVSAYFSPVITSLFAQQVFICVALFVGYRFGQNAPEREEGMISRAELFKLSKQIEELRKEVDLQTTLSRSERANNVYFESQFTEIRKSIGQMESQFYSELQRLKEIMKSRLILNERIS